MWKWNQNFFGQTKLFNDLAGLPISLIELAFQILEWFSTQFNKSKNEELNNLLIQRS